MPPSKPAEKETTMSPKQLREISRASKLSWVRGWIIEAANKGNTVLRVPWKDLGVWAEDIKKVFKDEGFKVKRDTLRYEDITPELLRELKIQERRMVTANEVKLYDDLVIEF